MHVELWRHFKTVLTSVWPQLHPDDKETCITVVKWADNQDNKYAGIASMPISQIKEWLRRIRDQHTGQVRIDLTNAITFLTRLNLKPLAGYYNTPAGCSRFGFYWYDGACHIDPKRIPVTPFPPLPPLPPPEPPPPDNGGFLALDYNTDLTLWWVTDSEYHIAETLAFYIENEWAKYYDIFGGDYQMAWMLAAFEGYSLYMTAITGAMSDNFEIVQNWIGNVGELEEDNLVDAILAVQTSSEAVIQRKIDFVFDTLGVTMDENNITIITPGDSFLAKLKGIIEDWEDQGKQLGGVSTEKIAEILNQDYKIYTDTIDKIYARLNNIEEEIGTSIEQVTLDLEKPVYEKGEGLDFIIPVSMLVFKDVIAALVDNIWRALDEIIDTFTTPINFLLQHVYDISDPWLSKLKEKLGDVGGEYDLEADTLYKELRSEVDVIISEVYELSDVWVEILANRLEGYFTTGIGEKGEKGDPGLPGAQGIQGIPGVKGDPGEPGEGVGLAIDDIDRQLKDKLVAGQAIVTANVTGVIDYNIEKIGEIFTRYDLEVKPITEFLTTDMRDTLTMIAESFETPEALIAFLLDVPEGQEDVTYELMQLLVAQIMERGLT